MAAMYRAALVAISIFACLATAAGAQDQQSFETQLAQIRKSPLRFYVASGEDGACGYGCKAWIAAEGYFDSGAAARFRRFLTRLGPRKLPVFFDSPGGFQEQALLVGRMLRERGITAGVANTFPDVCVRTNVVTCDAAKRSDKELSSAWSSFAATCNSACVYALAGASERIVPLGTQLGIHWRPSACRYSNGTTLDGKHPKCQAAHANATNELLDYVRQMGVDPALVEAAHRTPFEWIRYLSREEIANFGIDRREPDESRWMISPEDSGFIMVQFVVDATKLNGTKRFGAITIGCQYSSGLIFNYIRPIVSGDLGDPHVTAIFGNRKYVFPTSGFSTQFRQIDPDSWFERRELRINAEYVDVSQLKIETTTIGTSKDPAPKVIDISSNGFDGAWKRMTASCGWKS